MTPSEKSVVKSLIAVAWADGHMQSGELGVIEGLLCGFDATPEEEGEILEYARTPRSLDRDVPVQLFSEEERELLLTNAALLTLADRQRSPEEVAVLSELAEMLGFAPAEADVLIAEACEGLEASSTPPRFA
ncbi:MAG TPA: hypothetical protein VHM70_03920 [Polyangiaceae bacterium]|jgi:uncharacterized membrane protein YebE (DUF533 family)|nr:hypothetical protein [Polyangiaceae bacterium]